jgi:hypothetical protein
MIKIEHVHTCNWEAAIRVMRNPLNSWDKSDSYYAGEPATVYILGPNDLKLAKQLATAGSDHGKFLRQIIFSCDITAPMYWWKEMDTYKVGSVRNSCSTMHKIMSKEFTFGDFSCEYILSNDFSDNRKIMLNTIGRLNTLRNEYIGEDDPEIKKDIWYSLIQLLPSSYNQRSTWTANYEVLRNTYTRKNHKLDEWHVWCDMIEKLPYSELITEERK